VTCDIFVRSYWKDLAWLELCLASVARFCVGFREVVVVVPRSSEAWLRRRLGRLEGARLELGPDYPDDYLGQQVTKLHADDYTDADLVCHVDSDCIFCAPTRPDDLLDSGRPRIVTRPYALLDRHWPWRRPTEEFLGQVVTHDFMQRPPFVFPRWLYARLREHALRRHGVRLERYVLSRPPRGFSEFNALGAYAHAYHPEAFAWIDASVVEPGPPSCRWYWSWGGLDAATADEVRELLLLRATHGP
jgi:hypothetical protein